MKLFLNTDYTIKSVAKNSMSCLVLAFKQKKGSIIPSDYCYDRTNKGIIFNKKPRLFAFLGKGMYECLERF